MGEAAVDAGANLHFLVTGCPCANSREPCVKPFPDAAIGIMVVRVCADASVFLDAVPRFPNCGRAMFDHIKPSGTFCLKQQLVSGVGVAGVGEHVEQQVHA